MTGDPTGAGTLYGVGVGPGDPELITVKAARLISDAAVLAYHAAGHGDSIARRIADPYVRAGQLEEALIYPVTRGQSDHPQGYRGALEQFYAEAAERLAAHLSAGRDVVLLAEGDPTLFSSYMHMHKRLVDRFDCVLVPGVTSVSAAAAVAGLPLVEGDEVLSIVPATLSQPELERWLSRSDGVAIMKVSRNVAGIAAALESTGRAGEATYVRRASHADQHVAPWVELPDHDLPYMTTVLVPGPLASGASGSLSPRPQVATETQADNERIPESSGEVVVIGLGPAGPEWLTPEAAAELARAQHLVGYQTYVDRVPVTAGQQRHASDNRVEAERAEFALDLARRGERVAVVSSGDPGVFAMASAVLEVQAAAGYTDVTVRVLPGVTAANAVASRLGAPLGHDYCVLSLSDQLKPWPVILKRLTAAAESDLVIACYNPASKTRRDHLFQVRDLLLEHRGEQTPVIVGRAVGSPDEAIEVITLKELHPDLVDMRSLLIIGSSTTRVVQTADGLRVFTPRHYAG